jgi:hypothetical protein
LRATHSNELPIGMSALRSALASHHSNALRTPFIGAGGIFTSVPDSSGVARPIARWAVRRTSIKGNSEALV